MAPTTCRGFSFSMALRKRAPGLIVCIRRKDRKKLYCDLLPKNIHVYRQRENLIDGLDNNEEYIRAARAKNEAGSYYVVDIINFHYLIGTPDKGVQHFEER